MDEISKERMVDLGRSLVKTGCNICALRMRKVEIEKIIRRENGEDRGEELEG